MQTLHTMEGATAPMGAVKEIGSESVSYTFFGKRWRPSRDRFFFFFSRTQVYLLVNSASWSNLMCTSRMSNIRPDLSFHHSCAPLESTTTRASKRKTSKKTSLVRNLLSADWSNLSWLLQPTIQHTTSSVPSQITITADRSQVIDFFLPHPTGVFGQCWHEQETA